MEIRTLIENKDLKGLDKALASKPELANEELPFDEKNSTKAHPLHRICDDVFIGKISDEDGIAIADIFFKHGARVNGNKLIENKDSPLVAAASLHAEKLGISYIDHGADINHGGCHGGTALHWAAWTGRDKLVKRLIEEKAEINKRCHDYHSTPLLWAVHGYKSGNNENIHSYSQCVRQLLDAGADKTIPNKEGRLPIEFLDDTDVELLQLLSHN
jgi:ankyrin repeat protein